MKMFRGAVVAVLVILCIFMTICNAQETEATTKKPKKKNKIAMQFGQLGSGGSSGMGYFGGLFNDRKSCSHLMWPLSDCCTTPPFLPEEVFDTCSPGMGSFIFNSKTKPPGNSGIVPPSVPAPVDAAGFKSPFGNFPFPLFFGAQRSSGANPPVQVKGPSCLMECVFNKTDLLTETGFIDKDKLKKLFVDKSNDSFKEIVGDAVENCYTEYDKSDKLASAYNNCKTSIGQTMTCIRRYVELKCPTDAKNNPDSEKCMKRTKKLEACQPFYTPNLKSLFSGFGRLGGKGVTTQEVPTTVALLNG